MGSTSSSSRSTESPQIAILIKNRVEFRGAWSLSGKVGLDHDLVVEAVAVADPTAESGFDLARVHA
jgi:hypothetical protein